MNCHCDNKCFNYFNVSTNEMVYKCNTIEFNALIKTNQDWSNVVFERNKQTRCNFEYKLAYDIIKPRKQVRYEHWFDDTRINKEILDHPSKTKMLELKKILFLWNKNIIKHTQHYAFRIKVIANHLGWNSDQFNIPKELNRYGQRIYHFDWTSFMNHIEKCLYISLVISKHIGFRPITIESETKTESIVEIKDLYKNTFIHKSNISQYKLDNIKKLRRRMKRKAHPNYS